MGRAAILALICLASPGSPAEGRVPVLVELFTSEGCSSCPPADALLGRLVGHPPKGTRVVALGEHVDYWDGLGWKDRFSSAVFTHRQEAYARAMGSGSIYTPELVVGGRLALPGGEDSAARSAISALAGEPVAQVDLRLTKIEEGRRTLRVAARWAPPAKGELLMALVKDRATSRVAGGENAGKTLSHVAVVLALEGMGSGNGAFEGSASFDPRGADEVVVFVEDEGGGPVRGLGVLPL